jgi:hypothetical protein
MPYSIRFRKPLTSAGSEPYINDCCIGGDLVLDQLLPTLRDAYDPSLEATQEDWGWFVWFEHDGVKLAVDVFTHDHLAGEFEIHITSRRRRFLRSAQVVDVPGLDALRGRVVAALQRWPVDALTVEHLDENHYPAV